MEPVLVAWSGGKDSAMALQAVLQDPALQVAALLTTVTEGYERISMHGVRRALLAQQAAALDLPLEEVRIPPTCVNADYEARMEAVLTRYQAQGVSRVVFGDLFLEEVRQYRERQLGRIGMAGLFPLWGRPTGPLARAFIAQGFRALLVCVDPAQVAPAFCGRAFDEALLADLPASADPCGERGEFHTFVYEGPIFRRPVPVARGEVVCRDGFWFCDVTPAPCGKIPVL
ncbi:MAG: ATP-binding protein [Omnitrophica WOR_2 bacterium RIFCSPHIGHO2_02_FULL_68_15]|nr:MAG: ATP-binding protein [Omnitrophica WOR_2 bacterium RIFCSPHIGHO2_02_FULL_68_15]